MLEIHHNSAGMPSDTTTFQKKKAVEKFLKNNLSYSPGTVEKGTSVHRRFRWSWRNNLFPTKPSSMIHL